MKQLFTQLYRYGKDPNSHDLLKAFAILLMIVDHVGLYVLDNNTWMRVIGRGAAPLFFFLVGYSRSYRFKLDILVYGSILTLVSFLIGHHIYLNILINFVLIKWVLLNYNPQRSSTLILVALFLLLTIATLYISSFLEYGGFGLMFAIGGCLLAQKDQRGYYWIIATVVIYFIYESLIFNFVKSSWYLYGLLLISVIISFIMLFYHLKVWLLPKPTRLPILFLSRYSLQIYFWHLLILRLI